MNKIPVLVIMGPTATGKTALSLKLADYLPCEIVNADSMQVYRHMDIGTCKPSEEERRKARHHLIDCVNPDEAFNAGIYERAADKAIREITARKKLAVIVGGTGLYIRAVLHGLIDIPTVPPSLKQELSHEFNEKGLAPLYEELCRVDGRTANRLHPTDKQRILRGLEVYRATGKPLSAYLSQADFDHNKYHPLLIGLNSRREVLYHRINARVDEMMAAGFVEEVQKLLEMGYHDGLKPMQSLGYKEITAFLQGKISPEDTIEKIKQGHRRYAKRQMTWFKKEKEGLWWDPLDGFDRAVEACVKWHGMVAPVI